MNGVKFHYEALEGQKTGAIPHQRRIMPQQPGMPEAKY